MSTAPLEVYRHSGRFTPSGLVLPLVGAAAFAFPLGLVYSHLIGKIPFIYVNVLITLGYGLSLGWIARLFVRAGRVRNPAMALLIGGLGGLLGLYFNWSGHLRVIFQGGPWLYGPEEILNVIPFLYGHGSWGLKSGGNVTGAALAAIWSLEAVIIVGAAAFLPWRFVARTPFSEADQAWLDQRLVIDTLQAITDPAARAAVATGDLAPLASLPARAEDDAQFTRLVVRRHPTASALCTLRVQDVHLTWDANNRVKERTIDLTGERVLPAAQAGLLARAQQIAPAKA